MLGRPPDGMVNEVEVVLALLELMLMDMSSLSLILSTLLFRSLLLANPVVTFLLGVPSFLAMIASIASQPLSLILGLPFKRFPQYRERHLPKIALSTPALLNILQWLLPWPRLISRTHDPSSFSHHDSWFFLLNNPSPGNHRGARPLCTSLPVTPGVVPFPQVITPSFLGCKLLFAFDWALRHAGQWMPLVQQHLVSEDFF